MDGLPGLAGLSRRDTLLPAALAVVNLAALFAVDVNRWVAGTCALLACGLLVWRRRAPLLVGTASGLVVALEPVFGASMEEQVAPIAVVATACYSLARHVDGLRGLFGVALVNAAVHLVGGTVPGIGDVLFAGTLTVGPWLFGRIVLAQARSNAVLAEQARHLMVEQQLVSERAVADERKRIARELHDVVAHSLSVMVVQAGAAQDLLRVDVGAADRALAEVQKAGRHALGETGRLLHLLRDDADADLVPQPGLTELPRLVADVEALGVPVQLRVAADVGRLPAGLDLSVFRIVEESLTNAVKHAAGGPVQVDVSRSGRELELCVLSQGQQPTTLVSSGQGLLGMRERAAVFGGSVTAAKTEEGGFAVRARLPIPEEP